MFNKKIHLRPSEKVKAAYKKLKRAHAAIVAQEAKNSVVHVEGSLFAAPEDAMDKKGRRLGFTHGQTSAYFRRLNKANYLGYSDWHLATVAESKALTHNKNKQGLKNTFRLYVENIHKHSGPRAHEHYWTAKEDGKKENSAWDCAYALDPNNGTCTPFEKFYLFLVRPVRGKLN